MLPRYKRLIDAGLATTLAEGLALEQAASRGHHAFALSLRGHGGSPGSLLTGRLSTYAEDVAMTAASLPAPPVLARWRVRLPG